MNFRKQKKNLHIKSGELLSLQNLLQRKKKKKKSLFMKYV